MQDARSFLHLNLDAKMEIYLITFEETPRITQQSYDNVRQSYRNAETERGSP